MTTYVIVLETGGTLLLLSLITALAVIWLGGREPTPMHIHAVRLLLNTYRAGTVGILMLLGTVAAIG
ncbi:hypothetical protein [Azospirillum sp. B506]|uniref:hypothetical protein n=1 Tax=Azospirillum sp. B506 TaxID=137721 RepID=UPI00034CDE7C|nr:hypothetical protein [Azospirillum sp. B506]